MNINPVIKQYVHELLSRNPHDSVKIPSERDLCQQFGTSRPTVRKALGELINEGALIVRHGNGTYTNPGAVQRHHQHGPQRTLGVLVGSGSSMVLDSYYWSVLHAAQQAFSAGEYLNIPFLQLAGEGRMAAEEIRKYRLDALLWLHPDESRSDVIFELRDGGLPVCCVGRSPGGAPAAMIDYPASGRTLARYFLRKNCRCPLFVVDRSQAVHAAMAQAFNEELIAAGEIPDFRRIIQDHTHLEDELRLLQAGGCDFDGAFSFGFATGDLHRALLAVYGEEKFSSIEFVVTSALRKNWPDRAWLNIDGTRLGEAAGTYLDACLRHEPVDGINLRFVADVNEPETSLKRGMQS